MTTRLLFSVILFMLCAVQAWSASSMQAVDFIRFADNGNDVVIDFPGLEQALRNGADPNWTNGHESALSHFVLLCSISRNTEVDPLCSKVLKA